MPNKVACLYKMKLLTSSLRDTHCFFKNLMTVFLPDPIKLQTCKMTTYET